MPFDPNQPQAGELIDAVQLRHQFNGLKTLIDNVPAGPPGPPGPQGPPGPEGAAGPEGPAGEVTTAQLNEAIGSALSSAASNSSANTNGISTLDISVSDPPTQADVQQILGKLNDLIIALRR